MIIYLLCLDYTISADGSVILPPKQLKNWQLPIGTVLPPATIPNSSSDNSNSSMSPPNKANERYDRLM